MIGKAHSRLAWIKNRHAGERCVLVANGPSLNQMDLSFLMRETCIGLNKIFLGFRRFNFYPRYYVAVNPKVVAQSTEEIKLLSCLKFIGERAARHRVKEDGLTCVVRNHASRVMPDETRHPVFCRDIATEGLHEGWTVTYAALQIAYHLGFAEVVIIGLDHRFEYSGKPNEAKVMEGPDPNHFCPNYFGNGQTWDNPDLEHSEASFRLARQEYEKGGRRIIDATVNGACTIFDKVDYREFFGCQSVQHS